VYQHSNTHPLEPPTCDDRAIWDIWTSRYHFPALVIAEEIGLFRLLDQGAATAEELARRLELGSRATDALLGVVTALGLLAKYQGRFHLTATSRNFLLPGSPYYYGSLLQIGGTFPVTCGALKAALQKDKPEAYEGYGELTQVWESGDLSADQAATITAVMHSHSFPAAIGVARHGDFRGVQRLLDIGGGSGCFCIALALRYAAMRFTVLELPAVCNLATQYIAQYGLQDRADTLAANMFTDAWPSGYDAVLFSNIFHDWDRTSCLHLARRSFEALPPSGRIYLHELLLEDTKDGPLTAASFSMGMCLSTRGKQFSAGELGELLHEAGFGGISVTPTYAYYSLVSASKPE
jgi:hypothetical protein